jgi:4-diphosphocytidyl-2-C-methyl-D-erythritol kinase
MRLLSPAKINLFLKVTGKRPDGYHNLVTLMCRVGLYDTITLNIGAPRIRVTSDDPNLPEDQANLAGQAAAAFYGTNIGSFKPPSERVAIDIRKKIPVGAGLGGGSSNAAAVLMGLNRHYGKPLTPSQLSEIGLSIGADVPFFLFKKSALATGIGECLEEFSRFKPWTILLVFPGFSVSTAQVYKKLTLGLTKCEKILKSSLFKAQEIDVTQHLCNDLETVTLAQFPELVEIKKKMCTLGAANALMSGSGPSVFGLFADPKKAEQAKNKLKACKRWRVFVVDMLI